MPPPPPGVPFECRPRPWDIQNALSEADLVARRQDVSLVAMAIEGRARRLISSSPILAKSFDVAPVQRSFGSRGWLQPSNGIFRASRDSRLAQMLPFLVPKRCHPQSHAANKQDCKRQIGQRIFADTIRLERQQNKISRENEGDVVERN
jgi:hypothetical protein